MCKIHSGNDMIFLIDYIWVMRKRKSGIYLRFLFELFDGAIYGDKENWNSHMFCFGFIYFERSPGELV